MPSLSRLWLAAALAVCAGQSPARAQENPPSAVMPSPALSAAASPIPAGPNNAALCQAAIAAVEQGNPLPRRLLSAIAMIESGRAVAGGRAVAWPWTINVGGVGTFYETAEAAIAAATALQGSGVRSFDVGCMQVNLLHHPNAFPSLREAFDPTLNAKYAALFLGQLHTELGDWSRTVAAYHSRATEAGADYQRRVVRNWPDAASYGVVALPEALRSPVVTAMSGNPGSGIEAKLRETAADHAALTRRIVGDAPSTARRLSARGRPGVLRLAQGGEAREITLRR